MVPEFSELNDIFREKLVEMWKKGGLSSLVDVIKNCIPRLRENKLALSLNFNVSYSSIELGKDERASFPLAMLATSFSFNPPVPAEMLDILKNEEMGIQTKEEALKQLYKKGTKVPDYHIRFVPIVPQGIITPCKTCNGAGYVHG